MAFSNGVPIEKDMQITRMKLGKLLHPCNTNQPPMGNENSAMQGMMLL